MPIVVWKAQLLFWPPLILAGALSVSWDRQRQIVANYIQFLIKKECYIWISQFSLSPGSQLAAVLLFSDLKDRSPICIQSIGMQFTWAHWTLPVLNVLGHPRRAQFGRTPSDASCITPSFVVSCIDLQSRKLSQYFLIKKQRSKLIGDFEFFGSPIK